MNEFINRFGTVLLLASSISCNGEVQDLTTREALTRDLTTLASDDMEGRGLGQPGLERALNYAATSLQKAGTDPGFQPLEGPQGFLQPVPFTRYDYGEGTWIQLSSAAGERKLAHGEEMILLMPGREVKDIPASTPVFIGHGISEADRGWDDYAGVDVRDRMVFILEGDFAALPQELRAEYSDPSVWPKRLVRAAQDHGVAGMIIIPPAGFFEHWAVMADTRAEGAFAAARPYSITAPEDSDFPVIFLHREVIDELFAETGYDPPNRGGTYRSFPLDGFEMGLELDVAHGSMVSHNAVGFVRGTDPELSGEVVVVSAHIDHLGVVDGEIHNGANDDASGSVQVLELARRIARNPTPRSVLFALFTAEETDHLGSIHFLEEFPVPGLRIVSSLNLEQMGRADDGTLLATATEELLGATHAATSGPSGHRLRVAPLDDPQVIHGSDSWSFYLHGLPLVIIGGGSFPEYHSPGDDVELIDFELLADGVAIAEELLRLLAGGKG